MFRRVPLFGLAGAALAALAPVACRRGGSSAGSAQLMEADRAFARAAAERRLEGFRSFLDEEAATIRPNSPVVAGKQAVAERWASLLNDPAASITWKPLRATISTSGDLGFTVGSYEIARGAGQARTITGSGKYVTIWRRQPDRSWKVLFDSGVQDEQPDQKAP